MWCMYHFLIGTISHSLLTKSGTDAEIFYALVLDRHFDLASYTFNQLKAYVLAESQDSTIRYPQYLGLILQRVLKADWPPPPVFEYPHYSMGPASFGNFLQGAGNMLAPAMAAVVALTISATSPTEEAPAAPIPTKQKRSSEGEGSSKTKRKRLRKVQFQEEEEMLSSERPAAGSRAAGTSSSSSTAAATSTASPAVTSTKAVASDVPTILISPSHSSEGQDIEIPRFLSTPSPQSQPTATTTTSPPPPLKLKPKVHSSPKTPQTPSSRCPQSKKGSELRLQL